FTTDEPSHLARGVMLLRTRDYRINQHHPLLFNVIDSIPVAFNRDFISEDLDSENWKQAKKDEIASNLIKLNGGDENFFKEYLNDARFVAISAASLGMFIFYMLVFEFFGFL